MHNWGLRNVYNNQMPKLDETELHLESNLTLLKYRQALHLLTLMYHRSKHEGNLNNRDLRTGRFDKVKFKVITSLTKKAFKLPNSLGALMQDKGRYQIQELPTVTNFCNLWPRGMVKYHKNI